MMQKNQTMPYYQGQFANYTTMPNFPYNPIQQLENKINNLEQQLAKQYSDIYGSKVQNQAPMQYYCQFISSEDEIKNMQCQNDMPVFGVNPIEDTILSLRPDGTVNKYQAC